MICVLLSARGFSLRLKSVSSQLIWIVFIFVLELFKFKVLNAEISPLRNKRIAANGTLSTVPPIILVSLCEFKHAV